ncbi:uncharacterized protein LOC125704828 isoform X2 [Brienomyrus brachyistius]|uniref:uncharacterized protein LOC125704828 isoform X2 n=1 Tax=Brienomyrus brachyistius TaxID=42636 RepID=UPI0020B40FEE|nr:uncharacterized protein LOC125704828 isoform X2 [Brienomyrus brachyistius]
MLRKKPRIPIHSQYKELTLSGTSSMEQLGSRQVGDVKAVHEENPFCEDILLIGQEKCVEDWPEGSPELNPSWKPPGKLRLRRELLQVAVEMEKESREDMDESGLARSDNPKKGTKFKKLDESLKNPELLKEKGREGDVQDGMVDIDCRSSLYPVPVTCQFSLTFCFCSFQQHKKGKKFKIKFLSLRAAKETHQEVTNRENLYATFRGLKSTTELRDIPPGVASGKSPLTGATEPGQQSTPFDTMLSDGPEAEGTEDGKAGDPDDVNEGWKTVKQWNDMPLEEKELPEKEEAEALALLADRVQGGIHDFNRVFTEHAEGLWQDIGTLNAIADDISSLHKRAKVPSIIIPVNLDTSLKVPTMETGVAMTGCPSPASASITDNFSNSMSRKNLESIMEDYKAKMVDINNHLSFVKLEMEKLQGHGERRKEWTYHSDWEVRRALQIAMVGGDRVDRAVSVVRTVLGELTSFLQSMDSFYVGKDTRELKKSHKREFATKIQEVVQHLQEQHTELNSIREELQDAIGYI